MRRSNDGIFRPGDLTEDGWESVVDDRIDGWQHTGLRVAHLGDHPLTLSAGDVERMIVPLAGSALVHYVSADGESTRRLAGRRSVFDGPTDVLYLGAGTSATVSGQGRIAVAEAPTDQRRDAVYVAAADVAVELRGAGRSSRQVHNFGVPGAQGAPDAAKLIVCEVITPAENWSSYPPHKHDVNVPGTESELEEIYYFETAVARGTNAPSEARPFGMFSTYESDERPVQIDSRVSSGDIALVPYGYHGPAVAAPGYDLYYLNVMAGPGSQRAWLITDDPAHAWVRGLWEEQQQDPRLPYTPEATTPGSSTTHAPTTKGAAS